jgi:hypothetical protein
MEQNPNGDYLFDPVGEQILTPDQTQAVQSQINAFATKINALGIPANIKLMAMWLEGGEEGKGEWVALGQFGGGVSDYELSDGERADYGPGDLVVESSQPPGYFIATRPGAEKTLGVPVDRIELDAGGGRVVAMDESGQVVGFVELGSDNPQWQETSEKPATATTIPATATPEEPTPEPTQAPTATQVPEATATPVSPTATEQPVPTEVATVVPTETISDQEAQSSELEQVMKNIESWMSGEMQIDPSRRFTLLGNPYEFRRLGDNQRDYTKELGSLVHGVFLGAGLCYGTESFFVVGLEQGSERFYVVLRGPTTNYDAKLTLVTSQARTIEGENGNPRMTINRSQLLAHLGDLVGQPLILAFSFGFGDKKIEEFDPIVVTHRSHSIESARKLDETLLKLVRGESIGNLTAEQMALINNIGSLQGDKSQFLASNPLLVMIIR